MVKLRSYRDWPNRQPIQIPAIPPMIEKSNPEREMASPPQKQRQHIADRRTKEETDPNQFLCHVLAFKRTTMQLGLTVVSTRVQFVPKQPVHVAGVKGPLRKPPRARADNVSILICVMSMLRHQQINRIAN